MLRLSCLLIAVAVGLTTGPRVCAEPVNSPARQAFVEGRRAYNMGHFSQAIAAFETSYRLSGDPVLLFNLAQAHRQAGQLDLSLNAYRAYLRERPDALNRAYVENKIGELQERVRASAAGQAPAPRSAGTAAAATDISDPFPAIEASTQSPAAAGAEPGRGTPLPRWLPWVATAATAGLATAAVTTSWSVRSRLEELESTCAPPRGPGCAGPEVDRLESRARLRNLLWAAAGLSAAATGAAFYVNLAARRSELSLLVRF
jgi:hypothetical protein